jgi:hypothetical protein
MESSSVLWAEEPTIETHSLFVERDSARKGFATTTSSTTVNHWPIWIFVFFIAPGPLVFDLFERGFDQRMTIWLAVLVGTAIDYVAYYLRSRTHLALGKDAPIPRPIASPSVGRVVAIPRLGGLHHRYESKAA